MNANSVSVLIISYNCWPLLDACLHSLYASDWPIREIVVVDNASQDGTDEKLRAHHPELLSVINAANVGHTRAVNQGLRMLKGDYMLLLDADTEIAPGCLAQMMSFLDANPAVGMVAPRTYNSDGTIQESARSFPAAVNGLFGRQSLLTALFPRNPFSQRYLARQNLHKTDPFQVEQISAACMLFRRVLLDRAGVWDERYSGYWVDSDWCKRIQKVGDKIYCIPKAALVHHEQNKRTHKKSPQRIIAFHRGAWRFYRTHYTAGLLDPRTLLAGLILSLRCAILLVGNACKRTCHVRVDPLSQAAADQMKVIP